MRGEWLSMRHMQIVKCSAIVVGHVHVLPVGMSTVTPIVCAGKPDHASVVKEKPKPAGHKGAHTHTHTHTQTDATLRVDMLVC